jgi:HAD superfamily phosphatase (TIGR01668 family)
VKLLLRENRYFQPDMMFQTIYEITPEFLIERGIQAVLFDIDNTIAPNDVASPTEGMKNYFKTLEESGIRMAFVSNNRKERVHIFNLDLGYFYVYNARKPFSSGVRACIRHFNLPKEQIISVGDQIFTDCLAAHGAGLEFYMVAPVNKKESRFFRVKRFFERPFVQAFKERVLKDIKSECKIRPWRQFRILL